MRTLVMLLLGCCALPAQATLLRYEPFNYGAAVGMTVEGQMNPDGETWVGAYGNAVAPSLIKVGNDNLTVPSPLLPSAGNSAELDGGPSTVATNSQQAGKALRLPLGGGVALDAGGTIYYSLALRVDELTGSTNVNGGFFLALNNGAAASTTNPTAGAARLQGRIDPTDPAKYNLGVFRNVNATAAAPSWSGPLTVGETLFLVGSYESVAGAQNDVARLWINPNPSTFADPTFSPLTTPPTLIDNSTLTGTDMGVFSILLRQSLAPHLTLDELRVGTDWASVTPVVPEPSSLALLLFGCALTSRRGSFSRE
ncbi:MAG: PEP-CTERM sorting domain-containing protein [Pirellulales bacterium]|nr:PEP-CTERM sorting domain-containing protein [Pirellulales bacterium]